MEEVKRDGLYYACDELMTRYYECGDCEHCPVNVNSTCEVKDGPGEHHEECINKLKEYYQCQSDLVDGWDVVKEIGKEAVDNYRHIPKEQIAVTDYDAGVLGMSLHMANFIYYKLRDAGIEVE